MKNERPRTAEQYIHRCYMRDLRFSKRIDSLIMCLLSFSVGFFIAAVMIVGVLL